jgi:hypothetical protein
MREDGTRHQEAQTCPICHVPLFPVPTPEGLCRPCRARRGGIETARAFLAPIPYGFCEECLSCGAPALLRQVLGLEQTLPATVTVIYACVLCAMQEWVTVRLTAQGETIELGTRFTAPREP